MNKKQELLLTLLKESVEKCYNNESDLTLIERGMERASVARIFYYMQESINYDDCNRFEQFKPYNLDCEYNKNEDNIKCTTRCPNGTTPDMILHERSTNSHNLLVVEFKSRNAQIRIHQGTRKQIDFVKLEDFTNQSGVYKYLLGVYVKLNEDGAEYICFQDGDEVARFNYTTCLNYPKSVRNDCFLWFLRVI